MGIDISEVGQNMEVVNLWCSMILVYKQQIQTLSDHKTFHHLISEVKFLVSTTSGQLCSVNQLFCVEFYKIQSDG